MRLWGIRYIYKARLESRAVLVQELLAIVGIAVGVALLFASQVSSASLTRSVALLNNQLVGSTQVELQARGPEGVSEQLLAQARAIPGVRVVLPVLERSMTVVGPRGMRSVELFGVQPQAVRASGPLLRRFSARQLATQQAVALPGPLARAIGAGPLTLVNVQLGGGYIETLVGATLDRSDIGGLVDSPVAFAPLGYAQRLAGARGRISRIFVRYRPDRRTAVHSALAGLAARWHVNLAPGTFDTRLFEVAVSPQSRSESLFSAISALVGFMFALNAMLITVPSRRHLIADLHPHGASRLMIVQILLFDALVLGTLACLLGLALGELLSLAVFHATPGYLTLAFPIGNGRIVTWQSVIIAVAAGMLAAVAGVFWALAALLPRESKRSLLERVRVNRRSLAAAGLVCLAATTVTVTAEARAALVGNVTLVLGLLLLLPLLFDLTVRAFDGLSQRLDGVGSALAAIELEAPQIRVRSLAVAATAAVAVLGIVEFQGTQANLRGGLYASTRDLDRNAPLWVVPKGEYNLLNSVSFAPTQRSTLARIPGVARVALYRGSLLNWSVRRLEVRGLPPEARAPVPPSQFLGKDLIAATERVRRGGWALVSEAVASEHGLHPGSSFTLPSPRPITLRLAGLTTNLGWPPGAIIINSGDYARAWESANPTAYLIQLRRGVSASAERGVIQRALGAGSALAVETAGERERRHFALADQGLSRLTQIRTLVLLAAIMAIIGALGSMLWQRRDRIAAMKCHGYREAVLWRWLLCETFVILLAGSLAGAVFGLYAQLLGSRFLGAVTGFPVTFDLEGLAAVSSFGLVVALAVLILSLPGYLIVRVPPRTVIAAY